MKCFNFYVFCVKSAKLLEKIVAIVYNKKDACNTLIVKT